MKKIISVLLSVMMLGSAAIHANAAYVANRSEPVVTAGDTGITSYQIWDVCVNGDYVYAADQHHGLRIFQWDADVLKDVTPADPAYQGTVDSDRGNLLWIEGEFLYVATDGGTELASSGVRKYDISNPAAPVLLQSRDWMRNIYDICADESLVMSVESGGFRIYDAALTSSIRSNQTLGGRPDTVFERGTAVALVDDYAFVGYRAGSETPSIDIYGNMEMLRERVNNSEDLAAAANDITYIGTIHAPDSKLGTQKIINMTAEGNYLYVTGSNAVEIYDISDIYDVKLVRSYSKDELPGKDAYRPDEMLRDGFVKDGVWYISYYHGVNIYDINDDQTLTEIATLQDSNKGQYGIYSDGGMVYTASRGDMIRMNEICGVDITAPANDAVVTKARVDITGTSAGADAVQLKIDENPEVSVTPDADGKWIYSAAGLANGAHTITVTAVKDGEAVAETAETGTFTVEADYMVTGFEITEDYTATATVSTGPEHVTVQLVLALYKDNQFVSCQMCEDVLTSDAKTITTDAVSIPEDAESYTLKAFLWNEADMVPITDAITK